MVSHYDLQAGVVDAANQTGPDTGSHGRISGHIECPAHDIHIHSEAEAAAVTTRLKVLSTDPSRCCGEARRGSLIVVPKPVRALRFGRGLGQPI